MNIFISYRRDDSSYVTDRLYHHLSRYFDTDKMFRDMECIQPGTDFRGAIQESLQECSALLAVIGSRWLTLSLPDGTRRIEDPNDYVRIEIETALNAGVTVIPLLIEEVVPPSADQLPQSIEPLAYRQALRLRSDPDFESDAERLVDTLQRHFPSPSQDKESIDFGNLGL